MEATSEIAPPSILALRATKETSKRQQQQRHEATTKPQGQPNQQATDATDSHSASSSSHEKPRFYYPTPTLPQKTDTAVSSTDTTYGDTRQPPPTTTRREATRPAFVDTRRLREHQPNRLPQPQAQSPHNHARPSPTLATKLQDGRRIGPAPAPPTKGSSPTPTPPPDHSGGPNEATSLMQQPQSIAKTLTQPTDTATASEGLHTKDEQPTPPPPTAHSTMPPPLQSLRGSNNTTLPLPGNTEVPSLPTSPPPRSWQRVETQLEEIRRLAEHQAHQPITAAAETALIDLLVDSQTAAAVEAWDDGFPSIPPGQPSPAEHSGECLPSTKRARNGHSINRDAAAAARYLTALGHGQLSAQNRPLTYNSVEPQIAAIMRWLGTLTSDVEVHLQLPPTLAALRGILNNILDQQTNPNTWATMIEVGEALEHLVQGQPLAHPSDTLCLQDGGHDTNLVEHDIDQARGSNFIEVTTALLHDVDYLPEDMLPAAQEAALRLVRRIAARTPTMGDGPQTGNATAWWQLDRHHGLGDYHTTEAQPRSPTSRVSSDSGEATGADDSWACTPRTFSTRRRAGGTRPRWSGGVRSIDETN